MRFVMIFSLFIIGSCTNTEVPKLYIKTLTSTGVISNIEGAVQKDTVSLYTDDYLEVSLNLNTGGIYKANRVIEQETHEENFKVVTFFISNEQGQVMTFKTSTEFLNYMSIRKYELVSKDEYEFRTDYIFKKSN